MKMRLRSLQAGAAGSFLVLAGFLHAFTDSGQEEGITFDNELSLAYDSNIEGRRNGEEDFELSYIPTFSYLRQSGLIGLRASVGGAFGMFPDNSQYDYSLFRSSVGLSYPNASDIPYSLSFNGGYNETSEVDTFAGRRREKAVLNFGGSLRYNVNDRWGFRILGGWNEVDWDGRGLQTQETLNAGLDLVYRYSENLEFFAGYSYSDLSSNVDSETHTTRVRLEGEITPKITGVLGVGYQIRETLENNSGDPYVNLDLSWAVNERLELVATGSMGFFTTSAGNSGERSRFGLTGVYALGGSVSTSFGVSYQRQAYDSFDIDREDEFLYYQAGLVWQVNDAAQVSLSLTYGDADSTRDLLRYDRFRAGLMLRYTF